MAGKAGQKALLGWSAPRSLAASAYIAAAIAFARSASLPRAPAPLRSANVLNGNALVHEQNVYLLLEWQRYQTSDQQRRGARSIGNLLMQMPDGESRTRALEAARNAGINVI